MVKSEPKPSLMDTSPGKGYWKKQLAHVVAHLEAFTQREAEFRADIGKPKMGKVSLKQKCLVKFQIVRFLMTLSGV